MDNDVYSKLNMQDLADAMKDVVDAVNTMYKQKFRPGEVVIVCPVGHVPEPTVQIVKDFVKEHDVFATVVTEMPKEQDIQNNKVIIVQSTMDLHMQDLPIMKEFKMPPKVEMPVFDKEAQYRQRQYQKQQAKYRARGYRSPMHKR